MRGALERLRIASKALERVRIGCEELRRMGLRRAPSGNCATHGCCLESCEDLGLKVVRGNPRYGSMYTHLGVQICYTFVRVSIVVSISACHADDPGSIPGRGNLEGDLFQALGRMLLTVVLAFRKTFAIQANAISLLIDPNRSCHANHG